MPKMHSFRKNFQKLPDLGGSPLPALIVFDFAGDLKLRDVAKLCFFKLNMTKSNFKKISYDVILVTSLPLRHRKTAPK